MSRRKGVLCVDIGSRLIKSVVVLIDNDSKAIVDKSLQVTPAIVVISSDGKHIYTGVKAKAIRDAQHIQQISKNIFTDVVSLLGKTYAEYKNSNLSHDCRIVATEDGRLKLSVGARLFYPEEIISKMLEDIKDSIRWCNVSEVALNKWQSEIAQCIAACAGLILHKTMKSCALLHTYADSSLLATEKNLLFVDLGAQGMTVHHISVKQSSYAILQQRFDNVSSVEFTKLLFNNLVAEKNLLLTESERLLLENECERAKAHLSTHESCNVRLKVGVDEKWIQVTRCLFEFCIAPCIARLLKNVRSFVREKKIVLRDVNDFILVGGSSKIPLLTTALEHLFQKRLFETSVEPHYFTVYGIAASIKNKLASAS